MRRFVTVGILLASSTALAEPAPCDVHILRAPDKAKAVVEARIRAEPTCETSLVVRIVPTGKRGLYVLAHTPRGHVYELVARDARTAADLVALWASSREPVAAPSVVLAPPAIEPPPTAPIALAPIAPASIEVRAPGVVAESLDGAPRARTAGKWLALGGIVGDGVYGARGELDVMASGGWAVGLAAAVSTMSMGFDGGTGATVDFRDLRALATASYTIGRGAWQLRIHAGGGVVHSKLSGYLYDPQMTPIATEAVYPVGEVGVTAIRMIGGRWAVSMGPLATILSQSYRLDPLEETLGSRDLDVSLLAGMRRML